MGRGRRTQEIARLGESQELESEAPVMQERAAGRAALRERIEQREARREHELGGDHEAGAIDAGGAVAEAHAALLATLLDEFGAGGKVRRHVVSNVVLGTDRQVADAHRRVVHVSGAARMRACLLYTSPSPRDS